MLTCTLLHLSPLPAQADINKPDQILVLHSYHKADWTDAILSGINSILGQHDNIEWAIEYMDTKRSLPDNYLDLLTTVYEEKYKASHFDVVITSDDTAFHYALNHQHDVFHGAPIVFCGVNRFQNAMIAGRTNVTGVLEIGDFQETLNLAIQARPDAKTAYVICDSTPTAQINLNNFKTALSQLNQDLNLQILAKVEIDDLSASLASAPSDAFAFFISFWRDANGVQITPKRLGQAFKQSTIPVFGRSEWMLDHGLVGGKCVSGFNQGKAAALMAEKILSRIPANKIAIMRHSPNVFLFDHEMLKKYAISESILPEDAHILRKPERFYSVPKPLLIVLLAITACLSLLAGVLVTWRHRRIRMENALRHSEQRFRDLVESTSDFIWEINAKGKYTYVSPRITDILGYTPAEVLGLTPFELMPEEEARRVHAEFDHIIRTERPFQHLVNVNVHKDGRHVIMDTHGVPFHDHHGHFSGYRGIDRDITENRQLQERTQQSQKMEALGQLSGGIAHDFNNLLGGIIGSAELLKLDYANNATIAPHLDVILQSSTSAADLTRQLLSFSRQRRVTTTMVDLNDTVTDVRNLLERSIDKRIEIITEVDSKPCQFSGDGSLLQSAVLNLCINACDAMTEGGVLTLLARHAEWTSDTPANFTFGIQPGPCVQVIVRDTGTGIDENTQKRMFEPFYTTKTSGRGTGLGLTGVYGTTREHGGAIFINTEPGSGTEFTLSFPEATQQPQGPTADAPRSNHKSGHILVVDDDPNIRNLLCEMLKRIGHTVTTALDGHDGLQRFMANREHIDLIILDLRMPRMDGRECLQKIRETGATVPVIIASGLIQPEDIPILKKAGITAIIHKPYRIKEISEVVDSILAK